jgi:hypothetical protein
MNPLRLGVPVAFCLLGGWGATLLAQEKAPDIRREIDRLAYQIDESVRRVCRPSPLNLFGPAQLVRGYRIPGVGVVFVVPPCSLPSVRVARARGGPANRPASRAAAPAPASRETRSARPMPPLRRATAGRLSDDEQTEMALRAFEEQVRTMDEAAARMHQGVQQAMAEMMRDVQQGSTRDDSARGMPGDRSEGFPPLLLLPPWNESWGAEAPADPRPAEEVLREVRTALATALTTGVLAGLPPDEALVVTVEFFSEDSLDPTARPTATLVERLKARDVEAHEQGTLSQDDLAKRVEVSQF